MKAHQSIHYLAYFVFLFCFCRAAPASGDQRVGVVWTFPNETWIENIAVRRDGSILATSINRHALYLVDPFAHTAKTVHQFNTTESLLGISEIEDDVFAVASGNVDIDTSIASPGSSKLWKVDMRNRDRPSLRLISALPEIGTPDGVVTLTRGPEAEVLLADSLRGLIWRVDATTGTHDIAIKNDAFNASSAMISIGVDGLHIRGDHLYFTNLGNGTLSRIQIDGKGSAIGPVEKVADLLGVDDFALAPDGTAYAVGFNTLYKITPNDTVTTLAGGPEDLAIEGATSAQLGRTWRDRDVLYMGTSGGMLGSVKGVIHGGQILALNVGQYR